jgi:hypothetical protein
MTMGYVAPGKLGIRNILLPASSVLHRARP